MGYNRVVITGDLMELYEYDRNFSPRARTIGGQKTNSNDRSVVDSREDSLPIEQVRKKAARRPDNAKRAKMVFRRLVLAQLGGAATPLFILLTYAENQTDLKTGYRDFSRFIDAARRKFGMDFKYIAVPEFQRRGAVHFHILVWGLPDYILGQERSTRLVSSLWGRGFVFIKPTDGDRRLAGYLAKYMVKAYLDERLAGCKAYTASRNCNRPIAIGANGQLWSFLEDLKVIPTHELRKSEYETQWLGRCHYKQINLAHTYVQSKRDGSGGESSQVVQS